MSAKKRLILSITTASLLTAAAMMNAPISTDDLEAYQSQPQAAEIRKVQEEVEQIDNKKSYPQSVEQRVREYFSDIPIMFEVARCESTFRQNDPITGQPLRGVVNSSDVGVMQINEYYHLDRAERLGYNIYTLEGNLDYARYLYERKGTQPWQASQPCWGNI